MTGQVHSPAVPEYGRVNVPKLTSDIMTSTNSKPMSFTWQTLGLFGWMILSFSAASSAAFVSTQGWYQEIRKPTWNPPSNIFGPVWTTLYFMMAIAAWQVWREGGWQRQWRALTAFVLQWLLNALWTPLFFGMHLLGVAFAEIVMLWITIVVTIALFSRVRKSAALLLVPYLLWVSFAAFLNYTIWQLNS